MQGYLIDIPFFPVEDAMTETVMRTVMMNDIFSDGLTVQEFYAKAYDPDPVTLMQLHRDLCLAQGEDFNVAVSFDHRFYGFVRLSQEAEEAHMVALDAAGDAAQKGEEKARLYRLAMGDYARHEPRFEVFKATALKIMADAQARLDAAGREVFGQDYLRREDVPAKQKLSVFLID